jgi:hypothetical protein
MLNHLGSWATTVKFVAFKTLGVQGQPQILQVQVGTGLLDENYYLLAK